MRAPQARPSPPAAFLRLTVYLDCTRRTCTVAGSLFAPSAERRRLLARGASSASDSSHGLRNCNAAGQSLVAGRAAVGAPGAAHDET